MFDLFKGLIKGFSLLPGYLIFLALVLVILPTILAFFLRFFLYTHLRFLASRVRRLLKGDKPEKLPRIIEYLEKRFEQAYSTLETVNTAALIEGSYSQERFPFFGIPLRCESMDYFGRMLPNLLLSFGLLGTFLGITINLANLSTTISQVDVNSITSLVDQLNGPLQGMGIAFITSLIAVFCSALLTVVNLFWNTNIAKVSLINSLEDYLDNVYLPHLPGHNPMERAVDRLVTEFSGFLYKFGETVQNAVANSLSDPVEKLVENNQKTTYFAEQVYNGFISSSETLDKGATTFRQAADSLDRSRFAEKLSSATADLAIAQNQFSQSSLVLNKSTNNLETALETLQKTMRQMMVMGEELNNMNEKYNTLVNLNQKQLMAEEVGFNDIKLELNTLLERLKRG